MRVPDRCSARCAGGRGCAERLLSRRIPGGARWRFRRPGAQSLRRALRRAGRRGLRLAGLASATDQALRRVRRNLAPALRAGDGRRRAASGARAPARTQVVSKGMDPEEDAYSCFQARAEQGGDFASLLAAREIQRLFVGGLATDYCVKATALDALRAGLTVVVLQDAVRAVDVTPGDGARALAELAAAGAASARLDEVELSRACAASSRSRGSTTPSARSRSGAGSGAGGAGWSPARGG